MFTPDQLESIADMAKEKADAMRGYIDTPRINGERHFRQIQELADAECERLAREAMFAARAGK